MARLDESHAKLGDAIERAFGPAPQRTCRCGDVIREDQDYCGPCYREALAEEREEMDRMFPEGER